MSASVLTGLEPAAVFHWFEQLAAIPRGSTRCRAVSDFCMEFAKERGLRCRQDETCNVVIWKDASPGYEDHPAVMLQGHLDMVCVKDPDCELDLRTDGIQLVVDGDRIRARGTSLGGDNGIAVAMALALLDDDQAVHPPLEAVFTTDEEIGMDGAAALDASDLRSRRLLNMDSEEEGVLTVSCAGGATCTIAMPFVTAPASGDLYRLEISGLTGGHSGLEIHKGRANANVLLGNALRLLDRAAAIRLADLGGGTKDNAIPQSAWALLVAPANAGDILARAAEALEQEFRTAYGAMDPDLHLTFRRDNTGVARIWDQDSTRRILRLLGELPNGVQAMSREIEGLVETSLNLGVLKVAGGTVKLIFSVRSSVNRDKEYLTAILKSTAEQYGAVYFQQGDYPAWEYRKDSPLRDTMAAVYEELHGAELKIAAIHAGLECGLLSAKLPGLDCVSFGPDLFNVHTTAESMSIASVARTWRYLRAVLERL